MAQKKAARRRTAERRARRTKRPKPRATSPNYPPREDEQFNDVALILALGGTGPAAAYVAVHGACAVCRVRVGVALVSFVDLEFVDGPPADESGHIGRYQT